MDIKFIVIDVDGTLTDGKVYMGDTGELFKAFDIKDGCGIKEILPRYGIIPVIITARESQILANRCRELGIAEFHQGCRNKLDKLNAILQRYSTNYGLSNVAYIGDDLLDIEPMLAVKESGGMAVCPNNAVKRIKEVADFVCNKIAGEGAVREFIDWLIDGIEDTKLAIIKQYSEDAYTFAKSFFGKHITDGSYNIGNGVFANVMTYSTKPVLLTSYESHRKYIDLQYVLYGKEMMVVEDVCNLMKHVSREYDEEKDYALYDYNGGNATILQAGEVMVLKPNDAHRGTIAVDKPIKIRKIVFKVHVK